MVGGRRGRQPGGGLQQQTSRVSSNKSMVQALPESSVPSHGTGGVELCGMCRIAVGEDAIGCDSCTKWYHAKSLCTGLPENVVHTISTYGGDGISYSCNSCRLESSSTSDVASPAAIKQLFRTVESLCQAVTILSNDVKLLLQNQRDPGSNASGNKAEELKVSIREEIREMEERRKRRTSIIIRGLDVDISGIQGRFDEMSQIITGRRVTLQDVCMVDREKKIFRAKVLDEQTRKHLLDESRKLGDHDAYRRVFINRDLTYQQRNDLFRRRQQRRQELLRSPSGAVGGLPVASGGSLNG